MSFLPFEKFVLTVQRGRCVFALPYMIGWGFVASGDGSSRVWAHGSLESRAVGLSGVLWRKKRG